MRSDESSVVAYVALGSNLGDRNANINSAIAALNSSSEIKVLAVSSIIETAPVGPMNQSPYLNGAAKLSTTLAPHELLKTFLAIEATLGRVRRPHERWGPRQLDLDLLLYDDQIINQPGLHVPHPRMHERAFVLVPLVQIAADVLHPVLKMRLQCLLDRLEHTSLENSQ